ncbi:ParB N-terminal domain-containing protein [Methylocystis parvus]|uniref:ParB N-terminal domain-containing protein n=1 Tax=Methylocystis parvus TaxID=134 RepID=UPI003C73C482
MRVPGVDPVIIMRAIDALRPNPKNARTHSKRKIKDLAETIRAVGFIGAIVIDDAGMILAGHARHAAARLLGMKTVPTLCVTGLHESLVRAFVLADNKFAERAGWDRELLAIELEELSVALPALQLDLSVTGFEAGEVDALIADLGAQTDAPEDRSPPSAGPAVSCRGDLDEAALRPDRAETPPVDSDAPAGDWAALCSQDLPFVASE